MKLRADRQQTPAVADAPRMATAEGATAEGEAAGPTLLGRMPGLGLLLVVLAALTAWRAGALFVSGHDLFFDEAQYWTWAQDPAFGYFSKPPLVAWIITATTAVCGDGEACIRLGSPLIHAGTSLLVWAAARRLYDRTVAFWSALTYATLPGVAVSAGIISTDVPLLFFWALGLLAFLRAMEPRLAAGPTAGGSATGRTGDWLLLGAAIGLGCLAKYTMAFLVPCVLLAMVTVPEWRARLRGTGPWIALAVALACIAPNVWWNAANGFVSYAHTAANANLGGPLFRPNKLLEFVGAQFGVFGPILFAALLCILWRFRQVAAGRAERVLLCFALPVLALMTLQSFISRAHPNWAAVAYVPASILVVAWLRQIGRPRLIRASVALHLVAAVLVTHADDLLGTVGTGLPASADPYKRMRGWEEVAGAVGARWDAHPDAVLLADEREHLVELMYYLRPRGLAAVKWNPTDRIHDHYDLTTRLDPAPGQPVLLVTRHPGARHVAPYFETVERLPDAVAEPRPGQVRRFEVYLLEGFRGYDGP